MKTMVSAPKENMPPSNQSKKEESVTENILEDQPRVSDSAPFPTPKPLDSSLNPPPFGDLSSPASGSTSSGNTKSRSFDETFSTIEPPAFGSSGKGQTSPFDKPLNVPFGSSADEEPPPTAFGGSPFETPKASTPPPPYKEPEPYNSAGKQTNDPWGTPQTPFGQQSNEPFGAPQFGGQNDWTPPPAPVSSWQDQGLGTNTAFQPPVGTGGQNQTLAIVSLVCGIVGFCCGFASIAALITGFLAKKNAETNPAEYGGRGLAIAGMILGGISLGFTIIFLVIRVVLAFGAR